ncbi:flagellar FlbD family protein [Conexibacter woesei]|uniref:Flagellar FlbD family protein n=1 Tax=Conexibacter woesei (strain DSM 14684 / CCUG 47730 / CIP 108061 / JCM 11494 / NBRC 100937 / ID131577) TaxID=469383 RepID=D3F404_CONWI|nr:flagellar FlbD family protein [Conexibacter woesei]ADB48487.1 flagellar FlbD family protein [Conexibacter woesei DSM 14684]
MITLHRLGHNAEPFLLNPDLIMTVEATPDTVVTLTTGTRFVVVESAVRVAEEVRTWRTDILRDALSRRRDEPLPARSPLAQTVSSRLDRPLQAVESPVGDQTIEKSERPADYPER